VPNEISKYKTAEPRRKATRQHILISRSIQVTVLAITAGSSAVSLVAFGLPWSTIAITGLAATLIVSVITNIMFFQDARNRRDNVKRIAFLAPVSGTEPFYASMLVNIIQSASLTLGQEYMILPTMPTTSFETVSIWSLFASLEDRQLDIDGIIFIPDQPDEHFDELVSFHEERGDVPLVLVDVYFDLSACDDRTRAHLPSFVGGDEMAGGKLAAGILIEAVGGSHDSDPTILIINGGTAPWEQQRAVSFRSEIARAWPDKILIETPPFNYSRPTAYEYVLNFMRERANSERVVILDGIFACNDDMAIGAHAAISRMMREGYSFSSPPQIVGYDGIGEIREYISAGDPYIAGTVDVRIEEQAKATMLLMHKLIRSGQRRSEVRLIKPIGVRRHSMSRQRS
jgi:ABC-type sugar transport system substrate-binding protein